MKITTDTIIGTDIPEFASNSAAILGGLNVGDIYHTAGTLKVVTNV